MGFDDRILRDRGTGFLLDLSRAPEDDPASWTAAIAALAALEDGALANPDEGRQVGHYWLRDPARAPTRGQRAAVEDAWAGVQRLDLGAHTDVLLIGIGGSALGPQLLRAALSQPGDPARLHFLDNTDPEGFHRILGGLDPHRTLSLVVSKSGGTVETRNAMLAAEAWYTAAGTDIGQHGIAITGEGSRLDDAAAGWRQRLPIWDWVGGRTSITGPVGLAPMALCGWDWRGLLAGAAAMDALTRQPYATNPAARLASSWFAAGAGRGDKALVIEPYRDRLSLLGRYLQQLVMESLGKRTDRDGAVVHQGLTVYGNKGSTDQHAFMQQIRDGRDDAFVHFVETTRHGNASPADGGHDASDHLLGFLLGTRSALEEARRPSLTIRVPDTTAHSIGMLIALFERAVGLYAERIGINAYHQPGVEAGKRGARATLAALTRIRQALDETPRTAEALAAAAQCSPDVAWRVLIHLSATGRATVVHGERPSRDRFLGC
ncbi:MAG: glucose-6-phosphate isomerase [Myxococcota bacterium]|nr:glucose-6-phosphate isomerase [Myxococcota bacterium]